jgi:hypothetical protein
VVGGSVDARGPSPSRSVRSREHFVQRLIGVRRGVAPPAAERAQRKAGADGSEKPECDHVYLYYGPCPATSRRDRRLDKRRSSVPAELLDSHPLDPVWLADACCVDVRV